MHPLRAFLLSIAASLGAIIALTVTAQMPGGEQSTPLPDTPSKADAAWLQKKAAQAQARILANKDDRDQLMRAIKTNEVPMAKEVLLRNGFSAEDLEDAKIILRTGGGKESRDEIEISATCCDPKQITIQRSLDYYTK